MKKILFAALLVLGAWASATAETVTLWTEPTTNTIKVSDWGTDLDESMIIKYTPPSTRFEGDILWSEGVVFHECVKFSPYTKECVTKIAWQFGLKKDGTVVWREVEGK